MAGSAEVLYNPSGYSTEINLFISQNAVVKDDRQ